MLSRLECVNQYKVIEEIDFSITPDRIWICLTVDYRSGDEHLFHTKIPFMYYPEVNPSHVTE